MEFKDKVIAFFGSMLGRITVTVVSAVIVYGILMASLSSGSDAVFLITFIVCAYFGWTAINKVINRIFNVTLIMSFGKWAIYFLVKGLISVCIGALIAPFQIAKMISDKVSKYCEENTK